MSSAAAHPHQRIRIINDTSVSKSTKMTQFKFHIKKFDTLPTTRNHCLPIVFTFNGHKWILGVYPGGLGVSVDGYVSINLRICAEANIAVTFAVALLDKFGHTKRVRRANHRFDGTGTVKFPSSGWNDFIAHSDILDSSKNILGDDDELTLVVSIEIEQPDTAFVPIDAKNTLVKMIQGMFRDQETADVLFEVIKMEANEDGSKRGKSYVHFPAHRSILQGCAPMLAAPFGTSNTEGELATVAVHDVNPKVFRHLLWYVYGGTVSNEALKANAKDIIAAADKYSIVGLKLAAEAALVESTNITVENAIDNLLYADSKNLAVLKEAVIDFLVDNGKEVSSKASFDDLPGRVLLQQLLSLSLSLSL